MKKNKKEKYVKSRDGILKKLNIVLLVLLILEIILIPFLILAEVKKILPIICLIVLPTLGGILIILLARTCNKDYQKKKSKIIEKLNQK